MLKIGMTHGSPSFYNKAQNSQGQNSFTKDLFQKLPNQLN